MNRKLLIVAAVPLVASTAMLGYFQCSEAWICEHCSAYVSHDRIAPFGYGCGSPRGTVAESYFSEAVRLHDPDHAHSWAIVASSSGPLFMRARKNFGRPPATYQLRHIKGNELDGPSQLECFQLYQELMSSSEPDQHELADAFLAEIDFR